MAAARQGGAALECEECTMLQARRLQVLTAVMAACLGASWAHAESARLTYTKDVAPILNDHCVSCHRPGQIAPMSLMTYDEVRPWVKSIEKNVAAKKMPPWHATEHVGEFINDRSLPQEQVDTILAWIRQGAPRGNPKDMPPSPKFPKGEWKLGEPDFVVTLPKVEVPADGPDQFHNLPGKLRLPEDRWVKAVEILPGNPKVVHHVIVYQVKGFNVDPSGGWVGAWAAGTPPMVFPEGTGRMIQKGANVIGDMHYHPCGTPETDVTRIGLHFAKNEDIQKELVNLWIFNQGFKIPAGDPNHEVRASYTFLQDAFITGFIPHMHYRGKDFSYTAHYPDGRDQLLLQVENYDFNWQTNYMLKDRIPIPKGTVIECVAHYDNSADNPANPDPTKDITFGDESYDEMMIGFVDYVVADGVRPKSASEFRAELRADLLAKYPGEVYGIYDDDREDASPLYLPKTGDGLMYLRVNGTITKLNVVDITWNGDSFQAQVPSQELGGATLSGTLDPATGELALSLALPNGEKYPFKAYRLDPAKATSTD